MERGYLYVATGQKYVREAVASLKSLRRFDPEASATLVTDKEVHVPEFDRVEILEVEPVPGSRWKEVTLFKIAALDVSPYNRTFFVDTDTYFCDDCGELFDLLDYFDLLICHAPGDVTEVAVDGKTLRGYYPYNTGIIVYRNSPGMRRFFGDWARVYKEKLSEYGGNQAPFMEALLHHDIKTYVLQSVYNFRSPYFVAFVGKKVKVIHGREKDYPRVDRLLNREVGHRAWVPRKRKVLFPTEPLSRRVRDGIYALAPGFLRRGYQRLRGRSVSGDDS